jgi:putative phosphoesterase
MGRRSKIGRDRRRALTERRTVRIGVITDTHGLYDPAVEHHFSAVDEILHAGDIGGEHVIRHLRRLAPVTAVSGNVDDFEASGLPRRRLLRRSGLTIALCHVLYEKGNMRPDAAAWLEQTRPDVCIYGHSHKPALTREAGIIFFNPGSAGPRRFSLPRGIGLLTITGGKAIPSLIRLADRATASGTCSRRSGP